METIKRSELFDYLKERRYVYQMSDEAEIRKMLAGDPIAVYCGYDPTAKDFHIGHCITMMMLRFFQDAGHKVIILLGGATAMIGDPSGKDDMRSMVEEDFIKQNTEGLRATMQKFLRFDGENSAIFVNNADWTKGMDYVDFMRKVGKHFNVAEMLASEACKARMEAGGLTFLEMGYQLIQANDFVQLNRKYNCRLQVGGSDQWGNILAGVKLGRKINFEEGKEPAAFQALTCPLLLNSEGVKMGKTVGGAVWINKELLSPYEFYQYFYNLPDSDTENLLFRLTRIPAKEIAELLSDIIAAKKRMALEITKLVHGEDEANKAVEASKALFGGGGNLDDVPTKQYSSLDGMTIADVCVDCKIAASKSEVRKLIEQGGLTLNGEKVLLWDYRFKPDDVNDGYALLKKGKKQFVKIRIE